MVAVEAPLATNIVNDGAGAEGKGSNSAGSAVGKVSLPILSEVRAAQGAHGLKLRGDFLRYRRYCARRIARVRKCTSTTNGRGRYTPSPISAAIVANDPRAMLIPLYCAERAWAYAMDVKREQRSGAARARRTVVSRLGKAVAYARALRELCIETADADTCLEAEAYTRWMTATLALEKEEWSAAKTEFEKAQTVYGGLAGVHSGTAKAGVFEERVEEIVQAVRFCKYNISREGGHGVEGDGDESLRGMMRDVSGGNYDDVLAEKIEAALAAARKRAALSFGEVVWCGRTIPLRSEVVREAVLAATEETEALEKLGGDRNADHYDKVFMAYHDASKVVQGEIAQFREATATRAEERIAELEFLGAYLSHGRLSHTIERNVLLVQAFQTKKGAKPDDFVRLYDNLVHNVCDILALPGVSDDAEVANRVEAQLSLFRAYRCFYLARCYLAAGMHGAASQLFERAAFHATPLSATEMHAAEARCIVQDAAGLRVRARAQLYLREARTADRMASLNLERDNGAQKKLTLCENLEEFVSFANDPSGIRRIAEVPPALEAVPCKPVLFDLAVDGVVLPDEEYGKEKTEVEKEQQSRKSEKAAESEPAPSGALGAMQSTRLGRWWSGKG